MDGRILGQGHSRAFPLGTSVCISKTYGLLWEHYVLNEIQANFQTRRVNYWRDKREHEVVFDVFIYILREYKIVGIV